MPLTAGLRLPLCSAKGSTTVFATSWCSGRISPKQFVESGKHRRRPHAEVGILALSLAVAPTMRDKGRYFLIPPSIYPPIEQAGVILKSSHRKQVVENYRPGDKVKQRVVLYLGRGDLLAPPLDACVRLRQSDQTSPRWVSADPVSTPQAWRGSSPRRTSLVRSTGLSSLLDGQRPRPRHGQPLSERVFPRLANRLTRPGSEPAWASWLEDFYVCNAPGRRWFPHGKPSRRVKVSFDPLCLGYQTLEDLRPEKERLEKEIDAPLQDLFSLHPDWVRESNLLKRRYPGKTLLAV